MDVLVRKHGSDLKFAARMDYADVASWIKHLRDNIAFDARLRLVEASHREYEARCAGLQQELNALRAAPDGRARGHISSNDLASFFPTLATPAMPSLKDPYVVCDDFMPADFAAAMRQDIDSLF